MGSQPTSRPSAGRRRSTSASPDPNAILESHLRQVLLSIATLLIDSGYAYGRLSKLAREAFVAAASSALQEDQRKASIARIAASTGLTRLEVSKIVRQPTRFSPKDEDVESRSVNVAAGWISDRSFLDSRNRPRPLQFKGDKFDFTNLVRRYSGDIPARAMMIEMKRLGMISQDSENVVRLLRPAIKVSRATVAAMRAVSPWVGLLGESFRHKLHGTLSSNTYKMTLHFDSEPQVKAVMNELRARRIAFIQGLSELGTRAEKEGNLALRITVAVAASRPIRSRMNKDNR